MSWRNLIDIALIGTEKKTLDPKILPDEIGSVVASGEHDPEQQLLEAISLTYFYEQAGQSPMKFSGVWNDTVIEETKAVADSGYLDLFSRIKLEEHLNKEYLFNLWLDVLLRKQQIVNAGQVTMLLNEGNNMSASTKEKIVGVVGSRGAWALSQTSLYNYKPSPEKDRLWQEGSTSDRRNLFASLHRLNQEEAWKLLLSTWNTESIINKKGFLEIVKEQSTAKDVPFAGQLFETEFAYQSKEKKTERECRRLLAEILLRYPGSKLHQRTISMLAPYFTSEKGLAGWVTGKRKVSVTLPEGDDPFWNSQNMEQVYGVETKNVDTAVYHYNSLYWFSFFIETLPIEAWNINDAAEFFLNNDKFKVKLAGDQVSIFKSSLLKNVEYHRSGDLTLDLIDLIPINELVPYLKYLTVNDFESFVEKKGYLGDVGILSNGPYEVQQTWSLDFSLKVITKAFELIVQGHPNYGIGVLIARYADHNSYPLLIDCHNQLKEANKLNLLDVWNNVVFKLAHSALDIRNQINQYKLA